MPEIDKKATEHIAKLAKLSLSEAEIEKFTKNLSQIVKYVEQLNELNTSGIEPMIGAVNNLKALREDVKKDSGLTELMLKNAADIEVDSIRVPQMN